jgi:hypothetical protein
LARAVRADAIRWAKSVCAAYEETGKVPEWLLEAAKEALERSTFGIRLAFADYLREHCREAMRYFGDSDTQQGKTPTD